MLLLAAAVGLFTPKNKDVLQGSPALNRAAKLRESEAASFIAAWQTNPL